MLGPLSAVTSSEERCFLSIVNILSVTFYVFMVFWNLQADYFSHSQGYAKANPETAQYALKVEN